MRNCFKPKGSSNIDFNSLTAGAQLQSSVTGNQTQPHQSPLIKPASKSLKMQKSTTINPQIHNTYILPATTQSRTLQNQQQQELNLQLKSHGQLVQGSLNSKSLANIHDQRPTGSQDQANGPSAQLLQQDQTRQQRQPVLSKTNSHQHLLRPASGKKRASYLLQTNDNQFATQNPVQALGKMIPSASTPNMHLNINKYSSEVHNKQPGTDVQNPSFRTSPPKRTGQTRKPSGKNTKSNRAAFAKKQLVTNNSQIFLQNGVQRPQQQQNLSGVTTNGNMLHVQHAGNNVTSPLLAKINANSKTGAFQEANSKESQQVKSGVNVLLSGLKSKSYSQSRISSAQKPQNNTVGLNDNHSLQSSIIQQKKQSDSRKSKNGQLHHSTAKEQQKAQGHTQFVSNDAFKQNGLQTSNSVLTLSVVNNNKSKSMIEHGAVAAVVPSQITPANQIIGPQSTRLSAQNFLPTIQPTSSSTTKSQAMCAATSVSPYHSVENDVSNVPNQPIGSTQAQPNDYFNLKQSQIVKHGVAGSNSTSMRSTSQPQLQMGNTNQSSQMMASKQLHQSGSFVQSSGFVSQGTIGASTASSAQQKINNLIGKGLRSQSEPPQPQLKPSDSTESIMEKLRQRATFSVVMKAAILPKQPKRVGDKYGTEAQLASESVKATVSKYLQKSQPQSTLPMFQTSKVSIKAFGSVRAFAANTNVGIVRKANEDRISIILNVIQPDKKSPKIQAEKWPKIQIFGCYDGHGGSKCAEYLKDNLHNNIILQDVFPYDIPEAIRLGSYQTENDFLALAAPSPNKPHNKAGSCAIMILVVDDDIYILNVGDSRAIASESVHPSDSFIQSKASQAVHDQRAQADTPQVCMEAVSNVKQLSNDHKPAKQSEYDRIYKNGGHVYQTQTVMNNGMPTNHTQQVRQDYCPESEDSDEEENPFVGPYRVHPGRLSVCRTFGDCEAKLSYLGGLKGVVTCEPETTHVVDGVNSLDYVLIASDGVFDRLKNDAINKIIWDVTTNQRQIAHRKGEMPSIHTISGLVADEVLHASAKAKSLDNISVVFVAFKRFKEYVESMENQEYFVASANGPGNDNPPVQNFLSPNQDTPQTEEVSSIRNSKIRDKTSQGQNLNSIHSNEGNTLHENLNLIHKREQAPSFQSQPSAAKTTASLRGSFKHEENHGEPITGDKKQGAGQEEGGLKSQNIQSQFYLTKIREQQQLINAQQRQNYIDNINRPSSRQNGGSRKGTRSRKSNVNGPMANTGGGSHSQDSKPTLPQVSGQQPGTQSSKIAYNQLTDVKASGNSNSTSQLTKNLAQPQQQLNQHGQSQSTSNIHSNVQPQYPSNAITSTRVTMNNVSGVTNATQGSRRTGLFKVNAQAHNLQSQASLLKGTNGLPNFRKPASQTVNNSTGSANQIGDSLGDGAISSSRKKMKPYKSSQIRRMPDNSAHVPMKQVRDAGQSNGSGSMNRDPAQGTYGANNNQATGNHRF